MDERLGVVGGADDLAWWYLQTHHPGTGTSGITLLRVAHAWQEQVFDKLADGWSERQRLDFQRAMASLIERSYSLDA